MSLVLLEIADGVATITLNNPDERNTMTAPMVAEIVAAMDCIENDPAIGALRDAFSNAYLERQAFEEHFQSDILLGDLVWETTYGLPGEGLPPRVVAHITLNWPSWSQATYRQWYIEEEIDQQPAIEIEVVFRIQRLAEQPVPSIVDSIAAPNSPSIGAEQLERDNITIEISHPTHGERTADYALEITYEGQYELAEETLIDGASKVLDEHFGVLGAWVASTLVKLGDLKLSFVPADEN